MRKTFIVGLLFILGGAVCGRVIYNKFGNIYSSSNNLYYFLQEGVYSTKSSMQANTRNLANKLVTNNKDNYYVYLGITKDLDNAKKIAKLYSKDGYKVYLKEMYIDSLEFSNNVSQFDKMISNSKNLDDILAIENVVLANYQEIKEKNN